MTGVNDFRLRFYYLHIVEWYKRKLEHEGRKPKVCFSIRNFENIAEYFVPPFFRKFSAFSLGCIRGAQARQPNSAHASDTSTASLYALVNSQYADEYLNSPL